LQWIWLFKTLPNNNNPNNNNESRGRNNNNSNNFIEDFDNIDNIQKFLKYRYFIINK
jgi:hypothetical protein